MFDFELIPYWPWALVTTSAVGLIVGLITRIVEKKDAGAVVGGTIESCVYATLGCVGGLLGGLFFSWLLPAGFFSIVAFVLAGLCVVGIILGFVHGTAGILGKLLGMLTYLVIGAALVAMGILGWGVERGDGFVTWFAAFLALSGGIMGMLFALYRSAHWSVGWLLAFVNGSWGALGNLLGLFLHLGSWTFFSPKPHPSGARQVLSISERRFFHCWENGMRILPNYYFSQGPVMTADDAQGMWHEAVHVLQHYIFGPLMPIGYFAWAIVMGFFGGVIGWIKGNGPIHGAFAWGYLNNPYEVWEYASSWGTSRSTTRLVSASMASSPTERDAMVFPSGLAWFLTVVYLLALVGVFTLIVALNV